MILAAAMLSETMINKSSEDEPSFEFYKQNFVKLRLLANRVFHALKKLVSESSFKALSNPLHYFLLEFLETLIYTNLDMFLNETSAASEGEYSFPISKHEAKHMLTLANDILHFANQFRTSKIALGSEFTGDEKLFLEKIISSSSKMICYTGGYLQ